MKRGGLFRIGALISATVLSLVVTAGGSQQPSLTWLGTLGGAGSEAYGVSADGSVVVGQAWNAAGELRAFRWTSSGGMEDLNITYANLLTPQLAALEGYRHLPRWALYCGVGTERCHTAP
jgi:probable HAF family extracellular repeat protein